MNEEQKFWNFIESECLIEKQENNKPYRITIKERVAEVKKYENWYTFKKDGKNVLMFFAENNPLFLHALHKNKNAKKIWEEISEDGLSLLNYFLLSTKRKNCYSISYDNYELCSAEFLNKLEKLSFHPGTAYFNISEMLGDLTFNLKVMQGSTKTSQAYLDLFDNINSRSDNNFLFGNKTHENYVIDELKKNIALLNGNHYQPLYPKAKDICMSTHYMLNRASDDNIRNISDKITGLLIEFLETMPCNQFLTERIKTIKINQEKELLSHLVISKSNILGANRL